MGPRSSAVEVEVELELVCLPHGIVAVAIHLKDALAGTPIKSFLSGAPSARELASDAESAPAGADCACSAPHSAVVPVADQGAAAEQQEGRGKLELAAAGGSGPPAVTAAAAAYEEHVPDDEADCGSSSSPHAELHMDEDVVASVPAAPALSQPAASGGSVGQEQQRPAAAAQVQEPASSATLEAVMDMLQRLLSASDTATAQQADAQSERPGEPAAADAVSLPVSPADSRGSALPGGVEKLLALELEVVQLQQSLQIAQLEFETRTVQLHSLKQRADEAEQRAQAAEERASGLAQQAHQMDRQAGELRCQLGETAARQRQESMQLAARLASAVSSQQAAEEEAGRLRQQLQAAQQAAQQASEKEHAQLRKAAAQQAEWQERAAVLKHENQQLKVQVAAACGALKAMGIPAYKVFSRTALALAGNPASWQSPPESPAESRQLGSVTDRQQVPAAATQPQEQGLEHDGGDVAGVQQPGWRPAPPQVPRLQLSNISVQQLQQRAPQQQEPGLGQQLQQQASQQQARQQQDPPQQLSSTSLQELQQQSWQQHPPEQQLSTVSLQQLQQQVLQQQAPQQPAMAAAAAAGNAQAGWQQPAPDPYAHNLVAAGGMAALSYRTAETSRATVDGLTAAAVPLSARPAVTEAQQELLAAAQQWQLTARSAARAQDAIAAYRPPPQAQPPHASGPASSRPPSRCGASTARTAAAHASASRHQTPRATSRVGGGAMAVTPGGKLQQRKTYGQDENFLEIKQAYHAVMSSESDRASKWARSVFSSSSAVETDPRKVEPTVQGLLQLFEENGVSIPLQKCGPCQYRLGAAKLAVQLVNGRLMARSGAGQTMDVFAWLEKQAMPRAGV